MEKHKTQQYRRNQRKRHIRQRKRVICSWRYTDYYTFEWNEEHVMPTDGKLKKGTVDDSMKHVDICGLFHKYPISERKRAASMLDELREQDMAGIDGALKSKLSKVVRNSRKYKNKAILNIRK